MSTLLRDGFGRTVSNGLGSPALGSAWTCVSGADGTDKLALWDVASGNATLSPGDTVLALAGAVEAGNCEVLVSITSIDAGSIGGAVVLGVDTPDGIFAYYDKTAGGINITSDSLSVTMLTKAVTFPIWLRLRWADGQAYARVWNDGATEPTTWDVEMTLASTGPGQCGLYGQADTGKNVVFGSVEASTVSGWIVDRAKDILWELSATVADQLTSANGYERAAAAALTEYNTLRHQTLTETQVLTANLYEFDLPSGWVDKYSNLAKIEWPSGEQTPIYLERGSDWDIYGTHWRLLSDVGDGTSAILTYTAPHTSLTVPAHEQDAVAYLCAAAACLEVVARYSRTGDAVLPADSINYRTKADEWRAISKAMRQQAYATLGMALSDQGEVTHVGTVGAAQWDTLRP